MSVASHRGSTQSRPIFPWLLGGLALLGFAPLLLEFFANLWHQEAQQFFPLALAGAGLLAWRGLSEVPPIMNAGTLWITVPLVTLFLLLMALATLLWSPWIAVGAFLIAVIALAWWLGGSLLVKALLPAWVMLITMIPPPLSLGERFALFLQYHAVEGSSRILSILDVPHFRTGNILEIPGARLLVEQACSGINSVLFMTAACIFYALWQKRSFLFLILLIALTIIWIFVTNLIRITLSAWILYTFKFNLFSPARHEAVGLLLTACTLVFIIIVSHLLGRFAFPNVKVATYGTPHQISFDTFLSGRSLRGGFLVVALLMVLLGIAQVMVGLHVHHLVEGARRIDEKSMDGSQKFSLPQEIDGWKLRSKERPTSVRTAFESGIYSHIWAFEKGGAVASISLDYPFQDYHDVRICYIGSGWNIVDSKLCRADSSNGNIPAIEVQMTREMGLKGILLFSTVNESGVWMEEIASQTSLPESMGQPVEEERLSGGIIKRLRRNFTYYDYSGIATYRIQLLAAAVGGLDKQQEDSVRKLFEKSRLLLARQFIIPPSSAR